MTTASMVEAHRALVPINSFISSTGEHGTLMVTDIFIYPEKLDEYVRIVTPVVLKMRAMPECLFCELSQNPTDPSHVRVQHSWTKGTEWFTQVSPTSQREKGKERGANRKRRAGRESCLYAGECQLTKVYYRRARFSPGSSTTSKAWRGSRIRVKDVSSSSLYVALYMNQAPPMQIYAAGNYA